MGCKSPVGKPEHENEETTIRSQLAKGNRPGEGRLGETCEPMDKNRIEGRYGTTSWHNTAKSSGLPAEVNAVVVQGSIVPLPGEIWRERSGQKSAEAIVVGETRRSADEHSKIAGGLTQRRAELYGSALTAWRTVNPPMTPDGEVEPRVVTMGCMWAFRSGLRSVSHAGLSRVCAEPPCTDPYARWCGTRGGSMSQSWGPDSLPSASRSHCFAASSFDIASSSVNKRTKPQS